MKKIFITLMLSNVFVCFGQESPTLKALKESTLKGIREIHALCLIKRPDKPDTLVSPYIIINTHGYPQPRHPLINPDVALKKYGTKSVVIVSLKPGVQLVSLKQLLINHKLTPDEMALPVYVDNVRYFDDVKNITTTVEDVKRVMISKDSLTNEKYIDIRTGGPMRPKHQKIVI